MASLLEQSLRPGSRVGLTSSVDYFQRRGRADKGGINTAVDTIKDANIKPPAGTGINVTPSGGESAFGPGYQGGTPGATPTNMTAEQAQAALLGTGVANLVGVATNNPALTQMANNTNAMVNAGRGNYGGAINLAGSVLGVDPAVTGLVGLGLNPPTPEQAIDMAVSLVGLGVPNQAMQVATGLFGDVTTSAGDIAMNAQTGEAAFGDNGPIDNAQGGMAINQSNDPMGAFMGSPEVGQNVSGNVDAMNAAALGEARAVNENVTAQNGLTVTPGGGWFSPNDMGPQAPDATGIDASPDAGLGGPGQNGGVDSASVGVSGNSGASDSVGPDGSPGDGIGNGTGGWKDGGYISQTPGLTQRYMDGGQVMGGQGQMMMGAQPDAQQIQAQVAQMLRDPRRVQQMLARPMQLMQSGELTPDEVVTMGRVAQASMFNPELYPQLRQFVAAQGMNPLPPSYDPMVITKILAVSQALQMVMQGGQGGQGATPPGQVPSTGQAQMQNPTGMRNGGYLQGPGTGRSDSIGTVNETTGSPVKVSNGEYVIPAHVVRAKGRDFFDGLLRKYTSVPKGD
jgi:hypothetical protein